MFYLYYLFDPRESLPFYVGYTINEEARLKRHVREVKQLEKHGKCESNNLLKVGTIRKILESGERPILKVMDSTSEFDTVLRLETEHISKYGLRILNTGILTNMTLGGEGSLGKKKSKEELDRRAETRRKRFDNVWHSEETKKTISEARLGYKTEKPAWNTGKTKETDLSLAKMSESLLGNIPWNKNISKDDPRILRGEQNGFFGKRHSEKTLDRIREKAKNRMRYDCIHCGASVTQGNLTRWHNDNCKKK